MERHRIELKKPRGRPRSLKAHDSILTAAVEFIREVGYDSVTMEGIAARAGVGKATIYRYWSDKESLVTEAIARIISAIPAPDTGSTRTDLHSFMRTTVKLYEDPATIELFSGLVAAMARNKRIARVVRAGFIAAWNTALVQVLARGIERGDLRKVDKDLAVDILGGCFTNRALITGRAINDAMARALVDIVLRGLGETR